MALFFLAIAALMTTQSAEINHRGSRFIGIKNLAGFTRAEPAKAGKSTFMSPEIDAGFPWDEMVVSWDADIPVSAGLKLEARAVYPDRATRWYTMGLWCRIPGTNPRESVAKQKDADGDVLTDTLALKVPTARVQIRITEIGDSGNDLHRRIRFLGLSFLNKSTPRPPLEPNRAAWGKIIDVPERSQLSYKDQKGWCSPTSTSMVLAHWSHVLHRKELDHDVRETARGVFDKVYDGTGNWPFNTAYAASFHGIRAYISRFTDVSELEDWIAAGIPVIVSVSYRLMHEKGKSDSHIAVCVGFTATGEPIINDPWAEFKKGDRVRCVIPRKNLISAWAISRNTVYLIYPESMSPPPDRFGHWYTR